MRENKLMLLIEVESEIKKSLTEFTFELQRKEKRCEKLIHIRG